jgi:hypothetical protein
MSTTPLIRVDTTVKTNVKGSKVFALAFVKVADVTDSFTEDQIRGFVLPKLGDASLLGSAIVQLDSVTSGEKYHSGRGDESFTGILTQVFVLDPVALDLTTNVTTTVQGADFADSGINVYFMTMDGINETAVSSLMFIKPPVYEFYKLKSPLQNLEVEFYDSGYGDVVVDVTYQDDTYYVNDNRFPVFTVPSHITPSILSDIDKIFVGYIDSTYGNKVRIFYVTKNNRIFFQSGSDLPQELTGWNTHFQSMGDNSLKIKQIIYDYAPLIILSDNTFHTTTNDVENTFTTTSIFTEITRDEGLADSRTNFKPSTLPNDEYTYVGHFYRRNYLFKSEGSGLLYEIDPSVSTFTITNVTLDVSALAGTYDFVNTYELFYVFAFGTPMDGPKIVVFKNKNDFSDRIVLSGTKSGQSLTISSLATGTDYTTINTLLQNERFIPNMHVFNYMWDNNGIMYGHVNDNPTSLTDYSIYALSAGYTAIGDRIENILTDNTYYQIAGDRITDYYNRHGAWPTYVQVYSRGNSRGQFMLGH